MTGPHDERERVGSPLRRTKIVATIGPATRGVEVMGELIEAGADVFRLNFSHGTAAEHAENVVRARRAAELAGTEIGLLGDLPGPKLRLDEVVDGLVQLRAGSEIVLTTEEVAGDSERLPVSWRGLPRAVGPGDEIYLADGRIRLRVKESRDQEVRCRVEVGGAVASHQGINLPGSELRLPSAGHEDLRWVDFAVANGIDLLAVSFVRRAEDLDPVQRRLRVSGSDMPVIAKIEKPQGAENAEAIVRAASGGIMVARGDLGIELPIATVPAIQKRLLGLAGRYSKPSITATQMLASMVRSDRPTRAEVTDIANAIHDGTDAVMLSEETAVGENPVEAVRMMDRIALETERELPYGEWLFNRASADEGGIAGSVAQGAVAATYRLDLAALVVPTRSGRTARLVSAYRPRVPVLAHSPRIETVRRLSPVFGVRPVLAEDHDGVRELLGASAQLARDHGIARSGELVAITAGLPGQDLGTNLFEVHRIP